MKNPASLAALAAFCVACASAPAAVPPKRDLSEVVGVVHTSAKHRLPLDGVNESSLHEGANRISLLGSRAIKLWLNPNVYKSYLNFNGRTDWPTTPYADPVAVLQAADYQAVLDRADYKVYVLNYFPFHQTSPGVFFSIADGYSTAERTAVEQEVRAIADHLYSTYGDTDKVFIIANWEGDNDLNLKNQDSSVHASRLAGFQAYMQSRQDAVTASRNAHSASTCQVYCAFEVSTIPTPESFAYPTLVDNVVPNVQCDLYSYSSWHSFYTNENAELVAKLSYLRSKAPTAGLLGSDNLMIGEYGAYEQVWYPAPKTRHDAASDTSYDTSLRNQLYYSLGEGVRYAFCWQLLASGIRTDTNVTPRYTATTYPYASPVPLYYEELSGTWLIRPAGPPEYPAPTYTTAYNRLSRLVHGYIYRDPLANFANTFGYTSGLTIDTSAQTWDEFDRNRLRRTAAGEQRVAYSIEGGNSATEAIADWSVKVYLAGTASAIGRLGFSTFSGTTWSAVSSFGESAVLSTGGGYTRMILGKPAGYSVPPDTHFFRIHFLDSGGFLDTQVGSVTLYTEKPATTIDTMDNLDHSRLVSHSSNLAFTTAAPSWGSDSGRVYRTNTGPAHLVYEAPVVGDFTLTVYHKNPLDAQLEVAVSHDGNADQWQLVPWTVTASQTTDGWTTSTVKPASPLPEGRSFVRLRLLGGTAADYFAPQLGHVELFHQRDPFAN
ncbi:MAG TPA: hypothetical protein VGD81_15725 [Opitutaceae bacterium]